MSFLMETRRGSFERGEEQGRYRDLWLQRQILVARMMLEAATEEKMREICERLMDKAAAGSLEATKLVFRMLMGRRSSQLERLIAEEAERERTQPAQFERDGGKDVLAVEECEDSETAAGSMSGVGVEAGLCEERPGRVAGVAAGKTVDTGSGWVGEESVAAMMSVKGGP